MVEVVRIINENIITEETVNIPEISEIFICMQQAGVKFLSKIDLKFAYRQILLHDDDKQILRFTVDIVTYRMKRLPLGLKHVPGVFQHMISSLFAECQSF